MVRNQRKIKEYLTVAQNQSTTAGTNKGYTQNLVNLHDLIEGIKSGDGIQIRISSIAIDLRIVAANDDYHFIIQPVMVQTAGTWTDTADLSQRVVGEMLDASIDDVFGFQLIGEAKTARRLFPVANMIHGFEIRIMVPTNIVQLLNKETETERLQNVLFGVVGVCLTSSDIVAHYYTARVRYTEERKSITIR
jgi:hypothetical protein